MAERDAPRIVALGGGHGLSVALRATCQYAGAITAIVSIADDGGSSGRLRRQLGVAPPGDLRKSLVALAAEDSAWPDAFEYRFTSVELEGHALGNLMLVGLTEILGGLVPALDEAARVLGCVGRVLPATAEPVVLKAVVGGSREEEVEGQVAVANSRDIRRVELVPSDPPALVDAVEAIAEADQVILAPGSLYTSLLPVLCVPDLAAAIAATTAQVVCVANLERQIPETAGLDGTDHLAAVRDHGGRVDVFVFQRDGALPVDRTVVERWGVVPVAADVAVANAATHDPDRLAKVLGALL